MYLVLKELHATSLWDWSIYEDS